MPILDRILWAIGCHVIGDYVLQSDFIAKSKGENWYHLIVHCVLYCVPFVVVFGVSVYIAMIFILHIFIDCAKARFKCIEYAFDQVLHYEVLVISLLHGMGA